MIFKNLGKRKAIKSYVVKMKKDLASRYGLKKEYTSAQVNKTGQDMWI